MDSNSLLVDQGKEVDQKLKEQEETRVRLARKILSIR